MTTVLALEPTGGGADKPGTTANKGLILVVASSCISSRVLSGLLITSSPTGREEASKRTTCGGSAPGGKNLRDLLTWEATSAEASAISVLSKNESLRMVRPWMFLLDIFLIPFTYRNWSWSLVAKKPSICCGVIPP